MRFLVTGSEGQVGSALKSKIDDFIGLDLENSDLEIDVSNPNVVDEIEESDADVIVHTAAFHDVEAAEENPERAEEVNIEGTNNMVEAAGEIDAHLIFLSTDYVFEGEKGDYSEADEPNPLSEYARTKLEAEKAIRNSSIYFTIFRPSVIFDRSHSNFFTWAKSELEEKENVGAVTDQISRPTYAPNLADFIIEAAREDIRGLYHVAGNTKVSRYEAVQIMKEELGLEGEIEKITMSDLPWQADRPEDSSLDLSKLRSRFETRPLSLSSAFSNW